ncbi:hypothetical protein, partial [Microcystis wesenbergii]|uniref:hypothetical protein n=1 Tax=Microcystis wesenbergii TaxID=44823 RepID=UPI001A7EE4D1
QSAEVQKLWVLGKRQEAKVKREEKYVYLTSLGNAIVILANRTPQKLGLSDKIGSNGQFYRGVSL